MAANNTVNAYLGAYAVFQYSYQFPTQSTLVDNVFSGIIPLNTTSGTGSLGYWQRLYTSLDASAAIECAGKTAQLMTQETGLVGIPITNPDIWSLKSGVASIDPLAFQQILQLNPTYFAASSSSANYSITGMPLNSNLIGTDLITNGLPILVIHKNWQNASTNTNPSVPVLTDPNSFMFCKMGLGDRKFSITYDPRKQQVVDFTLTAVNMQGSVNSNVMGYYGTITAALI